MLVAVPRSLAATDGISVDFFSSGYLDVSVPRVRLLNLWIQFRIPLTGGFPHSETSGSKLVCQLPEAFRRLPRLSSPVAAKASTVCTYSLDHITPSVLRLSGAGSRMRHAQRLHLNKFTSLSPLLMPTALAPGRTIRRKSCVLVQCTNFHYTTLSKSIRTHGTNQQACRRLDHRCAHAPDAACPHAS